MRARRALLVFCVECALIATATANLALELAQLHQLAGGSSSSGSSICPLCTSSQCNLTQCDLAAPFACVAGNAAGGCASSASTWSNPTACTTCCSVVGCEITCPPCGPLICGEKPLPCGAGAPFLCTAGTASGQCGMNTTWIDTSLCESCCNLVSCYGSAAPGAPPGGNATCGKCPKKMCANPPCGRNDPFYCFTNGGCGINTTWSHNPACSECCSLEECYPPRPSSPWDLVPNSTNCTYHGPPYLAPNASATPWGGMDVSKYGCKEHVCESCCGLTPRFNWILSTCHTNASKRVSMACSHVGANNSALRLFYVSAYQYNGSAWIKDPTSSVMPKPGQDFVDLEENFVGGGWHQDWDLKYAPTTNRTGTAGLGPPGMLFVISALEFSWSAFYALNQITLNRGPGGEIVAINCWGDSSGELDFIESPFWAGIDLPLDRLYLTITADAGRCFPVQKNVPSTFRNQCTNRHCCEMCSCPNGTVCFGNAEDVGFQPMGCVPLVNISQIPNGSTVFEVDRDPTGCGKYFGGVSGGSTSNAYFTQQGPTGSDATIYAALVDRSGVRVFRWPVEYSPDHGRDAGARDHLMDPWPGIGRFSSTEELAHRTPKMHLFDKHPPCANWSVPCMLYEPSCTGDCPVVSAAGNFGPDELSGGYSAEAAKVGLNWWDLFDSIVETAEASVEELPRWQYVHTFTPPLPFLCNHSCSAEMCHAATRCPVSYPYMCTKGDGIGGCNNQSTFWPLSPHCGACCDVRHCEHPCTGCNQSICDMHLCSASAQYACTSGPDEFGCSSSPLFWPEQASCFTCCDIASCESRPDTNEKQTKGSDGHTSPRHSDWGELMRRFPDQRRGDFLEPDTPTAPSDRPTLAAIPAEPSSHSVAELGVKHATSSMSPSALLLLACCALFGALLVVRERHRSASSARLSKS